MAYTYVTEESMQMFADLIKQNPEQSISFPNDFISEFGNVCDYANQISESEIYNFICTSSSFTTFSNSNITFKCSVLRPYAFYCFSKSTLLSFPKCKIIKPYCFNKATIYNLYIPECEYVCSAAFAEAKLSVLALYRCSVIEKEAFYNSTLKFIRLELPLTVGENAFAACRSLDGAVIGSKHKGTDPSIYSCIISSYAFLGCNSLASIRITNCREFGANVFKGCKDGLRIWLDGSKVPIIDLSNSFPYGTKIIVGSSMISAYRNNSRWRTFGGYIYSRDGV